MSETETLKTSYINAKAIDTVDDLKTIGDCLKFYAEQLKDEESYVFAAKSSRGERQTVSWKELYEKSMTVARSLVVQGVKPGEFVAINIRPCPEWLFLAFGVMFAGARMAPISFTYTDGSDLIALMKKLETCCMLAFDPGDEGENWDIVKKVVDRFQNDGSVASKSIPFLRYLIVYELPGQVLNLKTVQSLLTHEHKDVKLPSLHPDEIFVVFQTSGSTGVPKFVAHTHSSFMFGRTLNTASAKSAKTSYFHDRPFNWMGGFPNSVIYGQKRVTISGFGLLTDDPVGRVIEIITEENCMFAVLLPPRIFDLMERKDDLPTNWPLVMLLSGGQPFTKQIISATGVICKMMYVGYGSTEMLAITRCILSQPDNYSDFYCGTVREGARVEIKVVGEDGEILPVNSSGEICVRSKGLFKGYYNDPEKTAAAFTPDGWYKTDDMGRITENAELYVEGRKSSLIVSGGMNVLPELIENSLKSCDGVDDVVVVPVADPTYYQVLCACIIKKDGSDLSEEMLRKYCESKHNDKIGIFAVLPKFYLFMDSFPKTSSGKYARKKLEKIAEQMLPF